MILLDTPVWPWRGRVFAHLISDMSLEELHAFAAEAGVPPRAFDGDHYDVPQERHAELIRAGARLVDGHELVRRLNDSGLRRRKRRGAKLLDSLPDGLAHLGVPHRLDVLRSGVSPPRESTVAVVVFAGDGREVLLLRHPRRGGWEAPGGWVEPGEALAEAGARELREETDLAVDPALLVPVGYEQVSFAGPTPGSRWFPDSHVAVFSASVPSGELLTAGRGVADGDGGPVGVGPEGVALASVSAEHLAARCGAAPWWPLLAAHAGLPLPEPFWARGRRWRQPS